MSAGLSATAQTRLAADAASYGSFQIQEFMPLIAESLLGAIGQLDTAAGMLAGHVDKIVANQAACESRAWQSTSLITAFLPAIGYERAQELVQEFTRSGRRDFKSFLEENLGADTVTRTLSPHNLVALGYRDRETP